MLPLIMMMTLMFIGDVMGPALGGLDQLLKLPTGCGEQNMLRFAPNIYVLEYLTNTHQLTSSVREKAIDFLRTGTFNSVSCLYYSSVGVAWRSRRTSVFSRRTFPVLRSICIWRVTAVIWVNRPLQVSQLGQLSLSSFRGKLQLDVRSGGAIWWMLTGWRPGVVD